MSRVKNQITFGRVLGLAGAVGLILLFVIRNKADEEYHPVAEQVAKENDKKD